MGQIRTKKEKRKKQMLCFIKLEAYFFYADTYVLRNIYTWYF
jgi:hypothetical protein